MQTNPNQTVNVQQKFLQYLHDLREEVTSSNGSFKIVFNGNIEIVSIDYPSPDTIFKKEELIQVINKGIKLVSGLIQEKAILFHREYSNSL